MDETDILFNVLSNLDAPDAKEKDVPPFRVFTLEELKLATNSFSKQNIMLNEQEWKTAPNVVYWGTLDDGADIAVKKFSTLAWPDANQFYKEAEAIGELRNCRLANLIGCCFEKHHRLLVAEFMPNKTLDLHLFNLKHHLLQWSMRLRVSLYIAEALEYCFKNGHALYYDINSKRVLFGKDYSPRLSCFGLMKSSAGQSYYKNSLLYRPPEFWTTETITPKSVVYNFGTMLLDMLLENIDKRASVIMKIWYGVLKLNLKSHFDKQLLKVVPEKFLDIVTSCLKFEVDDRPSVESLVSALTPLQRHSNVPSYLLICLPPLGEACLEMAYEVIYKIFQEHGYKDDDEETNKVWNNQTSELKELRQRGDDAFESKAIHTAIKCYSKIIDALPVVSPTILARRCVLNFLIGKPREALFDAFIAQRQKRNWATACYLEIAAHLALESKVDPDLLKDVLYMDVKEKLSQLTIEIVS